jgi:hypothetical protein
MTKDKYKLFGKKKSADVPRVHLDKPVKVSRVKKLPVTYVIPDKISKLEPPEDPRPEVAQKSIRPQLAGSYLAPNLPRIIPERPVSVTQAVVVAKAPVPPVNKKQAPLATSTEEFFSATKALTSKMRIPTPAKVVAPEPVPGSREAKWREFTKRFF